MKQDLQTFVWPFLNHFQARQCFAVRGVYPLMGSTDEVCMKYLLLTLELQVKKRRPYPVSLNSLLGRNWWAHKGRVWDKTGTELWSVSRHSEAFRQGDNLWKDWWFFCCQDHWVWRLNIRYPPPMLLVQWFMWSMGDDLQFFSLIWPKITGEYSMCTCCLFRWFCLFSNFKCLKVFVQ